MTEKEMVENYVRSRHAFEEANKKAAEYKDVMNQAEETLVNALVEKGALCTAKYDGLGRVQLSKPRLYANIRKEEQDTLFEYLKSNNEEYLIKPSVHPASLSSWVGRLLGEGKEVPPFISYIFKNSVTYQKG